MRSLYFEIIQISIFISYSPQVRLMRFVFSILGRKILTFKFSFLVFWWEAQVWRNSKLFSRTSFDLRSRPQCLGGWQCALVSQFPQERSWSGVWPCGDHVGLQEPCRGCPEPCLLTLAAGFPRWASSISNRYSVTIYQNLLP